MNADSVQAIQKHYGLAFPQEYLHFLQEAQQKAYDLTDGEQVVEWELRFMLLDDQFLRNNADLVDDVNPDPARIIPFAWSVSSGNNYLLDYRINPNQPAVVVIDHEEAFVREDAEDEAGTPEGAQQLMEENVRGIAVHMPEFLDRLRERND